MDHEIHSCGCDKNFPSEEELLFHQNKMKENMKEYPCPDCCHSFKTESALNDHKKDKVHASTKPKHAKGDKHELRGDLQAFVDMMTNPEFDEARRDFFPGSSVIFYNEMDKHDRKLKSDEAKKTEDMKKSLELNKLEIVSKVRELKIVKDTDELVNKFKKEFDDKNTEGQSPM